MDTVEITINGWYLHSLLLINRSHHQALFTVNTIDNSFTPYHTNLSKVSQLLQKIVLCFDTDLLAL